MQRGQGWDQAWVVRDDGVPVCLCADVYERLTPRGKKATFKTLLATQVRTRGIQLHFQFHSLESY